MNKQELNTKSIREYVRMNKQELNTKYGKFIMDAYKSGKTHVDTDSFKINPVRVVSRDNALCMYDYAKEILEVLNNEKG